VFGKRLEQPQRGSEITVLLGGDAWAPGRRRRAEISILLDVSNDFTQDAAQDGGAVGVRIDGDAPAALAAVAKLPFLQA
jgi:hypothetical protein